MTFCATCVVESIVATHFRNPVVGVASGTSGLEGREGECDFTTSSSVDEFSNQKRHVIYFKDAANVSFARSISPVL